MVSPNEVERAWVVLLSGVAVFCTPVWDWIVLLAPWWVPYLCTALLAAGAYWVNRPHD